MSLTLDSVVRKFHHFTAVDHLDLEIGEGEIYGLLGANGAGKTTTFRMILDILKPTSGRIMWQNKVVNYQTVQKLGYLPEERGLYPKHTVRDQIVYLARLKGMGRKSAAARLEKWLSRFNIPEYLNKKVEELSKGNQQKIQFISSVIHEPELLILDEPFTGLDPVNIELLKTAVQEIKKSGTTIIFSSHRMDHVEELCDGICIMHQGRAVASGSLQEVKEAYGCKNVIIAADFPVDDLTDFAGVIGHQRNKSGDVFQIANPETGEHLFRAIKDRGGVRTFSIQDPSIEEIFISKVGRKHG